MSKLIDFYNREHKTAYFQNSPSLLELTKQALGHLPQKDLVAAELGCGQGSQLEQLSSVFQKIEAFDFSKEALKKANAQNNIVFKNQDLCTCPLEDNKYDLIVDAHFLHCITRQARKRGFVLNSIKRGLKVGGVFVLEHMITSREMTIDKMYHYEIFSKDLYLKDLAFRHIPHALDIEKELLNEGFKIIRLKVPFGLKVTINPLDKNPKRSDPDIIQIIAKKEA